MKKLTFALACASTLALFAEPISTVDFEGYTAGFTGIGGSTDDGQANMGGQSYWLFEGGSAADESSVKAYGAEGALALPDITGSGTFGNNYLNIATEGGTLWRSIYNVGSSEDELVTTPGAPQKVGEGIYIDTTVQFAASEEVDAATAEGDKIAIWLNKDPSTEKCTLMVKCGTLQYASGELVYTPQSFELTRADGQSLEIDPSAWYRLTIKAIANIETGDGTLSKLPAFMIYLDGNQLACADGTNPADSEFIEAMTEYLVIPVDDLTNGKIFPSLVTYTMEEDVTLTALGVKGTGAIDNIVFTSTNPIGDTPVTPPPTPAEIDFTIAADGMTGVQWSTDGLTWNDYVVGEASALAGNIYIKGTNADGVTKVFDSLALSAENTELAVDADAFSWADYLGDAVTDGEGEDAVTYYAIDDEADLVLFAKGCKTLGSADTTFKLTADIALTAPWAGIGSHEAADAHAFEGTFDGGDYEISGFEFAPGTGENTKYRGFFNKVSNATIKNLTVNGGTFTSGFKGGALFAGKVTGSLIENCTAKGAILNGTHNVAGIVVKITSSTVKDCVNEANVSTAYTKVAGIAVFEENSTAAAKSYIDGCVNKGSVTWLTYNSDETQASGIVAWRGYGTGYLVVKDCSNEGMISAQDVVAGKKAVSVAQFVGREYDASAYEGTFIGRTDIFPVGAGTGRPGLCYATVEDGVATYIANSDVVADGSTYLVTATGLKPTFALSGEQSITFDTSLAAIDETGITAADAGMEVAKAVAGENDELLTFTVKAAVVAVESVEIATPESTTLVVGDTLALTATVLPEEATDKTVRWTSSNDEIATVEDNVVTAVAAGEVTITATSGDQTDTITLTITAPAPAVTYPTYIGEDADKKAAFEAWLTAKAGDTEIGRDADNLWEEAYLLNVAPTTEAVAAAKAEFKIQSITVEGNGTVTIVGPQGNYNGTVVIRGSATVNGVDGEFTLPENDANARFFKAFLVNQLPAAE